MQVCLVSLLFHWSAIWRHVRALGYVIVYPPSRLALNQRSISSHSTRLASIGNLRETLNHWPKEANDQCQTQGLTEEGGRHKTTVQPILNIQKEMQIKFVRKHTRYRKWEYSLLPQTFGVLNYGFIVLQTSSFYLRVRLVHCALPLAHCILVLTRFLMGYIVSSFLFQRALPPTFGLVYSNCDSISFLSLRVELCELSSISLFSFLRAFPRFRHLIHSLLVALRVVYDSVSSSASSPCAFCSVIYRIFICSFRALYHERIYTFPVP